MSLLDYLNVQPRFTALEIEQFTKKQLGALFKVNEWCKILDPVVEEWCEKRGIRTALSPAESKMVASRISALNSGTVILAGEFEEAAIRAKGTVDRTELTTTIKIPGSEDVHRPVTAIPRVTESKRSGLDQLLMIICAFTDLTKGRVTFSANRQMFDALYGDVRCPFEPSGVEGFVSGVQAFVSSSLVTFPYVADQVTLHGSAYYTLMEQALTETAFVEYLCMHWTVLTTIVRGLSVDMRAIKRVPKLRTADYGTSDVPAVQSIIPTTSLMPLLQTTKLSPALIVPVKAFTDKMGFAPFLLVGPLRSMQKFYSEGISDDGYWNMTAMTLFSENRGLGPIMRTINHCPLQSRMFERTNTLVAFLQAFQNIQNKKLVCNVIVEPNVAILLKSMFLKEVNLRRLVFVVTHEQFSLLPADQRDGFSSVLNRDSFVIDISKVPITPRSGAVKKNNANDFYESQYAQTQELYRHYSRGIHMFPAIHPRLFNEAWHVYAFKIMTNYYVIRSTIELPTDKFVRLVSWTELKNHCVRSQRIIHAYHAKPDLRNRPLGVGFVIASNISMTVSDSGDMFVALDNFVVSDDVRGDDTNHEVDAYNISEEFPVVNDGTVVDDDRGNSSSSSRMGRTRAPAATTRLTTDPPPVHATPVITQTTIINDDFKDFATMEVSTD